MDSQERDVDDVAKILAELEELRQSEVKYRELVEESCSIVLRMDTKGNVTFANRHALDFFGYTEKELLGRNVVGTIVPSVEKSGRNLAELIQDICDHPEKYQDNENENVQHDGTPKWIAWTNRGIFDASGRPREILCIGNDITPRKQAEEELRREQQMLRHLLESQQHERQLMAFEVHDGITQMLTATAMYLDSAQGVQSEDSGSAEQFCGLARDFLDRALSESRRLIANLRPPVLDQSGVVEAIRHLIETCETSGRFQVEFVCDMQSDKRFSSLLENSLYRIAQEGLNNAIRHSGSEKIEVRLCEQDGSLVLEIQDWGRGFDSSKVEPSHYGLLGIRERARILNGEASIASTPGKGTHVFVKVFKLFEEDFQELQSDYSV